MKRSAVLLFLFLAWTPQAYDGAGTASFAEMRMAYDARALAMAEAYTAMAEGVHGLLWNPAGMMDGKSAEVLLGYRSLPVEVQGGVPAYMRKAGRSVALGFGAKYLNYGNIDYFDNLGLSLNRSFTPFSFMGMAGAAYRINKKISAGFTVKGIYQKLDEHYAPKGIGADIGIRYLPAVRRAAFGIVAQNIGYHAWTREIELPMVIRAGATDIFARFPKTRFSLDVEKPIEDVFNYHLGAEYRHSPSLHLRGGYQITQPELERIQKRISTGASLDAPAERLQSWSLGGGYTTRKWTLDYALQNWGVLGLTHAVSLLFPL